MSEASEDGAKRNDLVVWVRQYDGIELLGRPRSVLVEGRWELRQHRELAEPEPVRPAEVISEAWAAEHAGLSGSRSLKSRLVYMPERVEVPKVAHVTNAMDVETVIARYRLAIELVDTGASGIVWVDAYTGEVIARHSLSRDVRATVSGRHYPSVQLDVTPTTKPGNYFLKDPNRNSLLGPNGHPVNGQGAARGQPLHAKSTLSYWDTDTAPSALVDAAFSLEQSWDFFRIAFGRRGLRDGAPSSTTYDNEGIVYLESSLTSLNAGMTLYDNGRATGIIRVNSGNTNWRSLMNLEVLGHEWTHGVFNADVNDGFFKLGEQAGLDEATSNFFGKLISMRGRAVLAQQACQDPSCVHPVPPIVEIPNTTAGWTALNEVPTIPAGYGHYMCRPSKSGSTAYHDRILDEWQLGMSGLDGHLVAGPINRMHCLLSRGLQSMEVPIDPLHGGGDPDLRTPLVPDGFAGIGSARTARIWYQALVFMRGYQPPVTFLEARKATLDAATVLHGSFSPEYKSVEDAFAAIRVGPPADREPPEVDVPWRFIRFDVPSPLDVTDPDGVASVTLLLDNSISLGTLSAPPWQVTIPSPLSEGPHTLTVTAKDTHNNEVARAFSITSDLSGPETTFTDTSSSQSQGRYGSIRYFDFAAQDAAGVSTARVLLDNATATQESTIPKVLSFVYLGTTSVSEIGHWVNLGNATAGPHELALETTDTLGNTTRVSLPLFREYDPPSSCTLGLAVSPSDWRRVRMTSSARDTGSSIRSVVYRVDGQFWEVDRNLVVAPGSTYGNTRETAALTAGPHTFQVECFDAQLNLTESAVLSLTLIPPIPPCNTQVVAGTNQPSTTSFNMGKVSGTVTLTYQTFDVHDRIRVMTPSNQVLSDVGCVATGANTVFGTRTLTFSGTSTLKVVVDPNCNPVTAAPSTQWNYRLSCPP